MGYCFLNVGVRNIDLAIHNSCGQVQVPRR